MFFKDFSRPCDRIQLMILKLLMFQANSVKRSVFSRIIKIKAVYFVLIEKEKKVESKIEISQYEEKIVITAFAICPVLFQQWEKMPLWSNLFVLGESLCGTRANRLKSFAYSVSPEPEYVLELNLCLKPWSWHVSHRVPMFNSFGHIILSQLIRPTSRT